MKRFMYIALTSVLLVFSAGTLFAAGAQEEATAPEEKLVITVAPWTQKGMTLPENTITELWLEERFNVELRPWYDVDGREAEQRNVKLAAGDIPDWLGEFSPGMVEIGIVRELPKEMIRANMPGYMKQADLLLGDEVWRRTEVDGVNYGIPAALSMASTGMVMGFRADWLRNVGFDPKPVPGTDFFEGPDSLDEIEDILLKFRNEDPDGDGKKDSYGYMVWKADASFANSFLPNVFGAFGIQLRTWNIENGVATYSMVDENYRAALKYINGWWKKEIIHPDTVTVVRKDVIQAITNDEFGAWSELDARMSQYESTSGPWGALRAKYPDVPIAYSITPEGPNSQRGTWYRDPNWTPWCIGINADDAKAAKIMQIAEALHTDATLYAIHMKGVEGMHWDWNADGYAVQRAEWNDPTKRQNLGLQMLKMSAHVVPPVDKVYIQPWRHKLQKYLEENQVKYPGYGFMPTFNEEERALQGNLNTIQEEFAWKAVTGQINIDAEWDGYVKAMMDAGLRQLLESVAKQ